MAFNRRLTAVICVNDNRRGPAVEHAVTEREINSAAGRHDDQAGRDFFGSDRLLPIHWLCQHVAIIPSSQKTANNSAKRAAEQREKRGTVSGKQCVILISFNGVEAAMSQEIPCCRLFLLPCQYSERSSRIPNPRWWCPVKPRQRSTNQKRRARAMTAARRAHRLGVQDRARRKIFTLRSSAPGLARCGPISPIRPAHV